MSRNRPLPAPISELSVALLPERQAPPFSWPSVFGREGPIELELGCGKGRFLLEACKVRPDSNFVGVEKAAKWFHRAVERAVRIQPANLRLARWDAFDFLDRWVPAGSLWALHVYFPDPWPKTRHGKRRLLRSPLYGLAARALAPGASFFVASDVEDYFAQAVADLDQASGFRQVPWPADSPDRIPTDYARKYLLEGRTLYHARFVRLAEA